MENLQQEPLRVYRGEIWMADLGDDNKLGVEQKGSRPVLIVGNDIGNKNSSCVMVSPITGHTNKTPLETHQLVHLKSDSTILHEQILTISKDRLKFRVTRLDSVELMEANYKIAIALGIISL